MRCNLCPRNCNIDRSEQSGYCSAPSEVSIAKVMLHQWEEPGICYGNGSRAIFFTGCHLKCVFCQNHKISFSSEGVKKSTEELWQIFLRLEESGACNINLVSPTPYVISVSQAIETAIAKGLTLPIVYNCSGYEKREVLRRLDGLVNVYLPDFKFHNSALASSYANAPDYRERAEEAISEMHRQTGKPVWEGNHLKKGTMVRHLILPNSTEDSIQILKTLYQMFSTDGIVLSLMSQYIPLHQACSFPSLSRKLTKLEYQKVLRFAEAIGFQYLYTQSRESASAKFVPDFTEKELFFLDKYLLK